MRLPTFRRRRSSSPSPSPETKPRRNPTHNQAGIPAVIPPTPATRGGVIPLLTHADHIVDRAIESITEVGVPVSRDLVVVYVEAMRSARQPIGDASADRFAHRLLTSTIWDIRGGKYDDVIARHAR